MIIRNSSLEQGDSFADPREAMKKDLPDWLQPFLTRLTAKPYQGEIPYNRTAIKDVIETLTAFGSGFTISRFAISQSGWCLGLVLIGWSLTVYSSRKLRLTIMHASSHRFVFPGKRKWNYWLGEFISILTLTLNFKAYQRGHNGTHHHSDKLLTPGDETYEYLFKIAGFRPGMTVDEAWNHLWTTLLSPKFYIGRFTSRLNDTFLSNSLNHNLLSSAFWLIVLGVVVLTNSWLVFLFAWVFPISVLFDASTLLRNCVEHRFAESLSVESSSKVSRQMTAAIFCGEATPQFDSSASWLKRLLGWTRWWLRMLFYHLPSRVLILTGDSPCHDHHHHNVSDREWFNCIFNRQKAVDAGEECYHSWSLLNAINETFKSLSLQPTEEDFNN